MCSFIQVYKFLFFLSFFEFRKHEIKWKRQRWESCACDYSVMIQLWFFKDFILSSVSRRSYSDINRHFIDQSLQLLTSFSLISIVRRAKSSVSKTVPFVISRPSTMWNVWGENWHIDYLVMPQFACYSNCSQKVCWCATCMRPCIQANG